MKRILTLTIVALLVCGAAALAQDAPGGLIAPPAIYMPYGGKVVTEVNLSDDDVLGIVKQAIPAAAEAIKDVVAKTGDQPGSTLPPQVMMAASIDIQGLMEAISGITNVRILGVRYGRRMPREEFLDQFNAGVAKAGKFSRIMMDIGQSPGAVAVYAQPDNAGYIGVMYNPDSGEAYAARVVGFVDVPKLIKWGGTIAAMFVGVRQSVEEPQQEPSDEPGEMQDDSAE